MFNYMVIIQPVLDLLTRLDDLDFVSLPRSFPMASIGKRTNLS